MKAVFDDVSLFPFSPRDIKDRVILSRTSGPFGFSQPLKILLFESSDEEEGFDDIRPLSKLVNPCHLSVPETHRLPGTRSWSLGK